MGSPTSTSLLQAAAEHPAARAYVAGMAVMLAVWTAVALARPRVFTCAPVFAAVDNRLDRRLLLGAVVVMSAAAWPVTVPVLAALAVRIACVARRRR